MVAVTRSPSQSGSPASVAPLDTGGLSPHVSEKPCPETKDDRDQLPQLWGDKEARKVRRAIHAKLNDLLKEMERGDHGLAAKAVGVRWHLEVGKCPGTVRFHKVCGRKSFLPHKCDFSLCPWCQHRRSDKLRGHFSKVAGFLEEPKFITYSPPNVAVLTSEAVSAMGKVHTLLMRRVIFKDAQGGIRSIETTYGRNGWNLHMHSLIGNPWLPRYPQTDIKWTGRKWSVVKKHKGLAREFTDICQKFSALQSSRPDFDIDNPDHWYFVDIRQADTYGSVSEIVKYIAKGVELVNGGAAVMVQFLHAIKGRRMVQPFGCFLGVDLDEDDGSEPPEAPFDCPYEDCPAPSASDWQFVHFGPGDWQLEKDDRTGSYRITGLARDGPSMSGRERSS